MRKYKVNGIETSMQTKINEITVEQFEKITKLQADDFGYLFDKLEILGMDPKVLDIIDSKTLLRFVVEQEQDFKFDPEKIRVKREIEIDGFKYTSFEGKKFEINGREFAKIDKKMKSGSNWMPYALAIIYKRNDLTMTEHQDETHIKHKEQLFKKITLDIALPIILTVNNSYVQFIETLQNVQSK